LILTKRQDEEYRYETLKMYSGSNIIMQELQLTHRSEWPRFHCQFNSWEVPEEFQHLKVEGFEGGNRRYGLMIKEVTEVMDYIQKEVGEKACSHYWNTIHRKDTHIMSEEEFEVWWLNEHLRFEIMERQKGNSEARKRQSFIRLNSKRVQLILLGATALILLIVVIGQTRGFLNGVSGCW